MTISGPLQDVTIVCVGGGLSRAPLFAARTLRDMGASVLYLRSPGAADALEEALVARSEPLEVVVPERLADCLDGREVAVLVHHGALPAGVQELLAARCPNRIELLWVHEDEVSGSDAAAQAVAGISFVLGEPDREPLAFPARMGEAMLGMNAAGAAVLSELLGRRGTVVRIALSDLWAYAAGTNWMLCVPKGIPYVREGRRSPGNGGVYPQRLFRARDGMVTVLCRSNNDWKRFLQAIGDPPWSSASRYHDLLHMAVEYPDEVDRLVEAETERHGRFELFELAKAHGCPLAPVRSPAEALDDPYLTSQRYWTVTPSGRRLPGPLWRPETWLPGAPDGTHASPPAPMRMADCRVLDLSWVWAGPMVGSFFADLGAEVIKVEHAARLDNMRLRGRVKQAEEDAPPRNPVEIDPLFHNVNRGKRSMLLDLKHPEGRELFLELVKESDLVIESFRPHVLQSWGLEYETLAEANPKIVLLSMRGLELDESFGRSGLRSYAPITSSLSGLEHALRYPGARDPVGGMAVGISDPVAGWSGIALALAALLHVARTGTGGWIRLSQLETLAATLPELYLEAQGAPPTVSMERRVVRHDGRDIVVVAPPTAGGAMGDAEYSGSFEALELAVASRGGHVAPVLPVEEHTSWDKRFGRAVLYPVMHPVVGGEELYGYGWHIDGVPLAPKHSAPLLGEDTDDIMRRVARRDDRQIAALKEARVLS